MAERLLSGTLEDHGERPDAEPSAALAGVGRFGNRGLRRTGHARWVRISHWILAASVLTLAVTGFVILMAHPRLYWGAVGNDLTPALFELPISRNYRHGGWATGTAFFTEARSPVSAIRTYDILNENSWGRSLHFLAAWFLVVTGAAYVLAGILSGHVRRDLVPGAGELTPRVFWQELISRLRLQIQPATGGPPYGLLQKCAYFGVVFLALPLLVITGLAMSPTITAAYPFVSDVFGGSQSARTIHFFLFAALMLFFIVHVLMVIMSGFKRQIQAMTFGN
jgi:thiosulfate reductase cytochrome b subunit